MKYMILIDTKFPFRAGESFLESEIRETAKCFDRIMIFPVDAQVGDVQTRKIEESNVVVYPFERHSPRIRKTVSCIKALFTMWKRGKPIRSSFYDSVFEYSALSQARKIEKILDELSFKEDDELYLYSYWLYIPARIICELKQYFKKRGLDSICVSRAHRFDIYEENSNHAYLPQRTFLLASIDHIYACSEDGAEYLRSRYPEYTSKISTSFLGTYDHGVNQSSTDGVYRIVSCSRVTTIKRVNLIAEAIHECQKEKSKMFWTHIGDGPEMQALRDTIQRLGLTHVSLLGAVSNTDVYNYYIKNPVDLFINVSSSEGLPVSIMEAVSFGIPVIVTDVGGTREIVNDITGKLISPMFTTSQLGEAICRLKNEEQALKIHRREMTREYWMRHFEAVHNYYDFGEKIKLLILERG